MAKKKGKGSKSVIPETVAGVKVPRTLRKSKMLGTLLDSPMGREMVANALIAAAGAAAAALVQNRPSGAQVARAGEAVADAGATAAVGTRDIVQTAAGALAEVVTDAARSFLPSALTGADEERAQRAVTAHREAKGKHKNRDKHSRH